MTLKVPLPPLLILPTFFRVIYMVIWRLLFLLSEFFQGFSVFPPLGEN